jgi:hypothetical protein
MVLLKKDEKFIIDNWKDSTSENVSNTFSRFIEIVHQISRKYKKVNDLDVLLKDLKLIKDYSKAYTNSGTLANKLGSMVSYMDKKNKKKNTFIQKHIDDVRTLMMSASKDKEEVKLSTDNQHRKNVADQKLTVQDMYDCLDYWEEKDYGGLNHLIMCSYCYILPRRLDFRLAQFVTKLPTKPNKKINYIIVDEKKKKVSFAFYTFKTSSKMEPWIIDLNNKDNFSYEKDVKTVLSKFDPKKLQDIILESYKENPRRNFFELNGSELKQSTLSQRIKNLFITSVKKVVNATDMRSIVISDILNTPYLNLTSRIELDIAIAMGQNDISTQRSYRIIQKDKDVFENVKLHSTPDATIPKIPPNTIPEKDKSEVLKTIGSINKYLLELNERYEKMKTK